MQRQIQIPPIHLRALLLQGRKHVGHQVAQELDTQVLIHRRHALLQVLQLLAQFLKLGLVRLLVFVAPAGGFVVTHLEDDGVQDGRQHLGVAGGQLAGFAQERQDISQRGDHRVAHFIILV